MAYVPKPERFSNVLAAVVRLFSSFSAASNLDTFALHWVYSEIDFPTTCGIVIITTISYFRAFLAGNRAENVSFYLVMRRWVVMDDAQASQYGEHEYDQRDPKSEAPRGFQGITKRLSTHIQHLQEGMQVIIDIFLHKDGYGVQQQQIMANGQLMPLIVSCSCSGGPSKTKDCATVYWSCDCTSGSPVITCDRIA
jgi:hypothetical protein